MSDDQEPTGAQHGASGRRHPPPAAPPVGDRREQTTKQPLLAPDGSTVIDRDRAGHDPADGLEDGDFEDGDLQDGDPYDSDPYDSDLPVTNDDEADRQVTDRVEPDRAGRGLSDGQSRL